MVIFLQFVLLFNIMIFELRGQMICARSELGFLASEISKMV